MSKKWYNLFVSVDQPVEEPAESGGQPAPLNAAQAVAEIAASVAPETRFSTPVTNATSFDEIYNAAEIHSPAHGFTVMKVAEMLRSEHIRNLPRDVKRARFKARLQRDRTSPRPPKPPKKKDDE